MKILLVEDNVEIATQVIDFLTGLGWDVDFARNATQGAELAVADNFDVILLDLNLPDGDGVTLCAQIKANATIEPAIIMVTARNSFEDKAEGFNHGADDYLVKPYDLRELPLRCQALLRRKQLYQSKKLSLGELSLDAHTHEVTRQDQPLKLTKIGFNILLQLARAYPKPVSKSQLVAELWPNDVPDSDPLKAHIYALRQVLDKPFSTPMLATVQSLGYRLEVANA
ncbi:response regulator transcription factor [Umboniibacter marinipuniceus]|uniref:DNA-binding response OmpR family regulator n=1 Tax=Umboniibacter marinipuniceus TaxID=569599 RepID=A0A3M0ADR5_9GAMM|nr:response regulator transcription factor [Umboniibacter marinipuniceus]RMA82647.1 DNA-binding response OmpR family regulator [Umboniibacter marinipuniceus]